MTLFEDGSREIDHEELRQEPQQVDDRDKKQDERRRHKTEGKRRGIEEESRKHFGTNQEARGPRVMDGSGKVTTLLVEPFTERGLGQGERLGIAVVLNTGVVGIGIHRNEEIVIAPLQVEDGGKPLLAEEHFTTVSEIATNPHVRLAVEGEPHVLKGNGERVVSNEMVEQSRRRLIATIAEHKLLTLNEVAHHERNPVVGDGTTIGIDKEQQIVVSRLDANGEVEFLARKDLGVLRQIGYKKIGIDPLPRLDEFVGLVGGTVIDDDHLEGRIVLLKDSGEELFNVDTVETGTDDDRDRWRLGGKRDLRLLTFLIVVEDGGVVVAPVEKLNEEANDKQSGKNPNVPLQREVDCHGLKELGIGKVKE